MNSRALLAAACLVAGGAARARIAGVRPSVTPLTDGVVFPNRTAVEAASFDAIWCPAVSCAGATDATLAGLTVLNFGTASAADVAAVTWRSSCAGDTGPLAMTYAGVFAVDGGSYSAWTWSGAAPLSADPCAECACRTALHFYADVAGCAAHGATIALGLGTTGGGASGGLTDSLGWTAPAAESRGGTLTIVQAQAAADRDAAAPGETVTYTVRYGRAGSGTLAAVVVTDTLPASMHYVAGSASPAADGGWDPDPGPPVRLRWTIPGPLDVTGGATGAVTFKATVDWGNEPFEPGSGATAAPEGTALADAAQVTFMGSPCVPAAAVAVSGPTVVGRVLAWQEADADVVAAATPGFVPEELTYALAVVNRAGGRTLSRATLWDTVPAELDAWAPGCGLLDPCAGATMTPTGCAATGRIVNGATTILTWAFDLAPGASQVFRWKGRLRNSVAPGTRIVNRAALAAAGSSGYQGSGASGSPAVFGHAVEVVERRSWVGYAGVEMTAPLAGTGWQIALYPLAKSGEIEVRGLEFANIEPAVTGGVSPAVGCLIGTCSAGFPGNAACGLSGGGEPGCGAPRAPARYEPSAWSSAWLLDPFAALYKATGNAPFLWEVSWLASGDHHWYAPTSSLTARGMTAYTYRRAGAAGGGDTLSVVNTGLDASGAVVPGLDTDVHVFTWNGIARAWSYLRTLHVAPESQVTMMGTPAAESGHCRLISTAAQIIVHQGYGSFDTVATASHAAMAPVRETGGALSATGAGTFYLLSGADGSAGASPPFAAIGNVGQTAAVCRVSRYEPAIPGTPPVPLLLGGGSGSWRVMGSLSVPAGFGAAGNPALLGAGSLLAAPSSALFKVEVQGGGPAEILHGNGLASAGAGAGFLDAVGGGPLGTEFWYHQTPAAGGNDLGALVAFCPVQGTAVSCVASDGYASSYTTTGPDQAVFFMRLTDVAAGSVRSWKVSSAGAGVLAMFSHAGWGDKGYAPPVIRSSSSCRIVAPPVAFAGVPCWITVTVLDGAGNPDTGYTGTMRFTSTDPGALLEGQPLGSYLYAWTGLDAGSRVFANVIFTRPGGQTLTAADAANGSTSGMAALTVAAADIRALPGVELQTATTGGVVQFVICWSNYSAATASGYTITDAIPDGTDYYPDAPSSHFCGATKGFGAATVSYSTAGVPSGFQTMAGVVSQPPAVTHLRWTIPAVGVATTGCVCFKVTVQ